MVDTRSDHATTTPPDAENSLQTRLEAWRKIQYQVASQVVIRDDPPEAPCKGCSSRRRFKHLVPHDSPTTGSNYFGGVDVSFPEQDSDPAVAVYVIVDSATMKVIYQDYEYFYLTVPYVSSYLSFREIDPLERLVAKQLQHRPEVRPLAILVDGNGVLHERRAGLACFLGVRTGVPAIGVGKKLYCEAGLTKELVKKHQDQSLVSLQYEMAEHITLQQQQRRGRIVLIDRVSVYPRNRNRKDVVPGEQLDRTPILHQIAPFCCGVCIRLQGSDGAVLGCALLGHGGRIKPATGVGTQNPIFISVGHDVSLEEAVVTCAQLSLARIPEPVRQADLFGRDLLRRAAVRVENA